MWYTQMRKETMKFYQLQIQLHKCSVPTAELKKLHQKIALLQNLNDYIALAFPHRHG